MIERHFSSIRRTTPPSRGTRSTRSQFHRKKSAVNASTRTTLVTASANRSGCAPIPNSPTNTTGITISVPTGASRYVAIPPKMTYQASRDITAKRDTTYTNASANGRTNSPRRKRISPGRDPGRRPPPRRDLGRTPPPLQELRDLGGGGRAMGDLVLLRHRHLRERPAPTVGNEHGVEAEALLPPPLPVRNRASRPTTPSMRCRIPRIPIVRNAYAEYTPGKPPSASTKKPESSTITSLAVSPERASREYDTTSSSVSAWISGTLRRSRSTLTPLAWGREAPSRYFPSFVVLK